MVSQAGAAVWRVPVVLTVRNFSLPDLPQARTMLFYSQDNINRRYLGQAEPEPGSAAYTQGLRIADRHFQLAHRHKISLISEYNTFAEMNGQWLRRLNGRLFTAGEGYAGVGAGVGNNVYSIGTYSSWPWYGQGEAAMRTNTDAWVNWFESHSLGTATDYFLYLIDESDEFARTERWAQWINNNPGPGRRLMSLATISLPQARASVPSLDIPTSAMHCGPREAWRTAAQACIAAPDKRFYFYNGARPASGSFATEDDGVALRVNGWIQFKKGIDRWFYWESTYYRNYQGCLSGDRAETNVFQQAVTFGCDERSDQSLGRTGWNYFNGDGVLFYPGTDVRFPGDSYRVRGPLASLRLKHWRRGIQDADYLALASAVNPARTNVIVNRMIPRVLWEYGVSDPADPTYVYTNISWPIDPDRWEAARRELADIIEGR